MEEDGPTGHPEWIRIARPDERHECEKNCLLYLNWERCSKLVWRVKGYRQPNYRFLTSLS